MDFGKVAGIVAEGVEKSCHSSTKSRWRGRGEGGWEGYLLSAFLLSFFQQVFQLFSTFAKGKAGSLPLPLPSPSHFLELGSGEIGESGRVKSHADQPDTNNGVELTHRGRGARTPVAMPGRPLDDLCVACEVFHGYSVSRGVPWGVGHRRTQGNKTIFKPGRGLSVVPLRTVGAGAAPPCRFTIKVDGETTANFYQCGEITRRTGNGTDDIGVEAVPGAKQSRLQEL